MPTNMQLPSAEVAPLLIKEVHRLTRTVGLSGLKLEPDDDEDYRIMFVRSLAAYYENMREHLPNTLAYIAALEAKIGLCESKIIRDGLDGETIMYDPSSVMKMIKGVQDEIRDNADNIETLQGEMSEAEGKIDEAKEKAEEAKEALKDAGLDDLNLAGMQSSLDDVELKLDDFDPDDLVKRDELYGVEGDIEELTTTTKEHGKKLDRIFGSKKDRKEKALVEKMVSVIETRPDGQGSPDLAATLLALVREARDGAV